MENRSENNPVPEIIDVKTTPQPEKERKHHGNRLFWPVLLVLVGLILLAQNLHWFPVNLNWWAAFIFIPVVGSLTASVEALRRSGRFDAAVRNSLGSAIVVGTVATLFLFGMDWSKWWPLMVIAPGFSMLLNSLSFADAEKHINLARWSGLGLWFGLAVLLLGLGFLTRSLPIPALEGYLFQRWWAVPILIPGIGAFLNATIICAQNGFKPGWTVWSFCVIGVVFAATGLFALYHLNWGLLAPIILIGIGLIVMSGFFIKK